VKKSCWYAINPKSKNTAIAQFGLTYCDDVANMFSLEKGYATPKIDVRSFIIKDDKLLLVKERSDGLWTLPGGWADVNESPSEAVVRETKEETGYDVSAIKLLACGINLNTTIHRNGLTHINVFFIVKYFLANQMKILRFQIKHFLI